MDDSFVPTRKAPAILYGGIVDDGVTPLPPPTEAEVGGATAVARRMSAVRPCASGRSVTTCLLTLPFLLLLFFIGVIHQLDEDITIELTETDTFFILDLAGSR